MAVTQLGLLKLRFVQPEGEGLARDHEMVTNLIMRHPAESQQQRETIVKSVMKIRLQISSGKESLLSTSIA